MAHPSIFGRVGLQVSGSGSIGCSVSAWNRFKYAAFPVLFLNSLMLLVPVLLFILIRGWFFTRSWRKHRARNTIIILTLTVFTLQVTPLPVIAADNEPGILDMFLFDHFKERLAKMYGAGCPTHFDSAVKSGWPTHHRVCEGMGGFTGFRVLLIGNDS